jgi:hypothetical protein
MPAHHTLEAHLDSYIEYIEAAGIRDGGKSPLFRSAAGRTGTLYSLDGACTNWAEEFFSRMRRAEQGHHHHIAGPYLLRYAQEASCRIVFDRSCPRRSGLANNHEQAKSCLQSAIICRMSVKSKHYHRIFAWV